MITTQLGYQIIIIIFRMISRPRVVFSEAKENLIPRLFYNTCLNTIFVAVGGKIRSMLLVTEKKP